MIKHSPKNIQTQTFKIIILVAKTTKEQYQRKKEPRNLPSSIPKPQETKGEVPLTLGLWVQGRHPGPRYT